jgi:glycosyltransferase involved in cell wall biosynthesis
LTENLPDYATVLLIDDGSIFIQPEIEIFFDDKRIHVLRHETPHGPAAARNTGIKWCRDRKIQIVVLLDSDCIPEPKFVDIHVRLHKENQDAVCIGGAIQGVGRGIWANLDRVASWFTSIPGSPPRKVTGLYHIPTTNMSLKLQQLPLNGNLFDCTLRTGEDVKFVKELRKAGGEIIFSPVPVVRHFDREKFRDFFCHQYRWGLHTYAMRFGGRGSPLLRTLLALAFAPLIPAFALLSALTNMVPLTKASKLNWIYFPPLLLLYFCKGIAVAEGIIRPERAIHGDHIETQIEKRAS